MLKKLKTKNLKLNRGFTLIELVIVAGILTIIASFVLTTINPMAQFQKTNDGRRKSDLAQIQRALEAYYQDNGKYPDSDASSNPANVTPGGSWSPYMNEFPSDPSSSKKYVYRAPTGGQSYRIYASLERNNDSQGCYLPSCNIFISNLNCSSNSTQIECNYGVSSPDVNP